MANKAKVGDRIVYIDRDGNDRNCTGWKDLTVTRVTSYGVLAQTPEGVSGDFREDMYRLADPLPEPEPDVFIALGGTSCSAVLSSPDGFGFQAVSFHTKEHLLSSFGKPGHFSHNDKFYKLVPVEVEEYQEKTVVTKKRLKI